MSRYAWSEDDTFELIRLYEVNAPLWDTKHADYRNREVKSKIISNIAMCMNVTTEEINRKLHNLRNQVSQELNKLKKKRKDNSGDEIPTSNWSYFEALKFLIPNVINRSKTSDVAIQRMVSTRRESTQRSTRSLATENDDASERKREERRERKSRLDHSSSQINSDVKYEEEHPRQSHPSRILPRVPNEDDRFGEYVALELRSLRSEVSKRKLKSEIRRAICRIADLDDAGVFDSGASSNPSSNPSPPYSPPPIPVPTYIPVCEITSVKSESI